METVVPSTAIADHAAPAPATELEVNPAEVADPAPAAGTQADPQASDPNADPANTGEPGAAPAEEPKVKLSELLAQKKRRKEAELQVARLQGQLEAIQPKAAPAPAAPEAPKEFPPLEEFEGTYDQWVVAKAKFELKNELKADEEKNRQTQQVQTQAATAQRQWAENCQKASAEIPDLAEVLNSDLQPFPTLPDMVSQAIKKIDNGPAIVYYLHKNPAEGTRLAQMDPVLAVMELASIREKAKALLKPTTKKVTSAPPPINPGGGQGVGTETDTADLSMTAYAQRRLDEIHVKVGGKFVPR